MFIIDKYVLQTGCIGSLKKFEPFLLLIFCFWKWKHSSSIIASVIGGAMEVEYSGGGVLIFSYLILILQRDTFGGLYDNQVEPRQLDTSEFIGCALLASNSVQTGFAGSKLS